MKTRIITAIVALLIFIPVLVFASTELFLGITILNLAFAVLSAVGTYEAVKCIGMSGHISCALSVFAAFLLPLLTKTDLASYTPVLIILLFALLFIGVLQNEKITCDKLLTEFALTFYVAVSFGAMTALYNTAVMLFPLIFLGAWVTDTFAYFSGYFFGKHKLIESVSPKKTVEGAIGGTLAATVTFGVYTWIATGEIGLTIIFVLVGLAASIVSQLGDLAASLIKRHWGIKDYGKLFPGHGGVLDRFDSILAVSVFLYAISLFVKF